MSRSLRQFIAFFTTSFKAQFRTPSAWVWGFLFPVIFIVMFGFISMNPSTDVKIGVVENELGLTSRIIENYREVENIYEVITSSSKNDLLNNLNSGNLAVVIEVLENSVIKTYTNSAQIQNVQIFYQALDRLNLELTLEKLESDEFKIKQARKIEIENQQLAEGQETETRLEFEAVEDLPRGVFTIQTEDIGNQETRYVDFVLPGILGYSLLSSAVFGVAYSFLSLRKTKVLKRLFAAPTNSSIFILGQSMSRFVFIFTQTLLQLLIAHLAFDFSPIAGGLGWFNLVFIMFIALLVFLSFGYCVAGVAKNNDVVAPMANLIVLPQFILAGTFFTVDTLPEWLQTIVKFLPLYNFNEAMRYVAIDGLNLWNLEVLIQILFLVLWAIFGYFLASKVFKVKEI